MAKMTAKHNACEAYKMLAKHLTHLSIPVAAIALRFGGLVLNGVHLALLIIVSSDLQACCATMLLKGQSVEILCAKIAAVLLARNLPEL